MSFPAFGAVATRAPDFTSARKVIGQTAAGLLVAGVAATLTVYATRHATRTGIAVVLMVGGTVWFLTTRRTQLALALLMLYLGLLDGYLKLSTGSNLVTFVRDGLLYAIVIGLLVRAVVQGKRLPLPPLSLWVVGFVILVVIELLNPDNGSLYHSLAGARQDLEFVPLFFLTFAFVRTTKALRTFAVLLAVIAAANGIANIVQFRLSPQQLAKWGPGYAERVLGTNEFGEAGRTFYDAAGQQLTRPFGLMSDAGTGGLVCAFGLGAILALGSLRGRRRYLLPATIAAAIAAAGIFTSQGRAVVVCGVVILLAYALLSATTKRGVAAVLAAAAVAGVSFLVVIVIVGSHSGPVRYQGLTPGGIVSLTNQQRGGSFAAIPGNLVHYPFGGGLGTGGPAAGLSGAPTSGADTENEISYQTLETGIPGMLVVIGFTVALCALGVRYCRQERDGEARILIAAIIAPLVGMLVLYSVNVLTPTSPGGPYLWAAGGIVSYWLIVRPAERRRAGPRLATD